MEMYMDSKEYIYTFAFNVLDDKYTLNVYSFDKQDILLFIHQHGFENGEDYIQLVPYEKNIVSRYQDKMLKPFKFKSNSSNEEYTVMTTEFILEKCLTNAGEIITKSCWLSSILPEYNSMSLFNYINEAVEQLKYATVMDWQMLIDDSTCIELNPDVNKNIIMDKLMQSAYLNNVGEGFINENIQEITIESYVNGFATLS